MVRIPLLVLFLVLIALTLVSIGTLVGVLDSLLADEAKRSAEAAVRGALEHAGELVAAPFDETVPLVRRMAADTFERNDRLDDGRTDPALFRPLMQQYLATIKGSAAPLYALYQTFMVAGDNNSWTFAGCFADDNYCLMYRSNGYITVAATYPKINTTITGSATGVSTWNYTTSPFAARVRGMTRADSEGRWGLPELFYDQVTKLTVPFITFHVPVFFDAQGRALLSENIDLKSDGLKAQLRLVKLPDTDVILVHRDQGTLLATTFNIPSYKTPTSGTALWPATATPSDALNTATRRFLSLQKESVVIDSDLIYGVYPVTRGTLRLMVLTVTKKEYFFDTLKKARIIGICVACGCGAVCVIVALLVTFLIHRALTQLRSAMGPASRLQMDPAEYKAQGTSFVYDIATLQEAFGLMNEKLHEAGSYLPQSVKAAWAHEDGEEDDEDDDDDDDNMSATIVSVKETSSFSPTSSRSQSTAPGTSGRDSVLHVKSSTSGSRYNLRRGTTKSAIGTEVGSRKSAGVRQVRHSARIAVLQVNLVGFHKATASMPFDTVVKKSAVLTDLIVAAAKAHKGILDAFQGDRYTLTFNAVTTCAAQTRRAVACALAIREGVAKAGDKSFDLPVSCGVASGMASIGDIGSTAMRRFGVLSHVVAQASVLERMCRQYGPEIPCVVAQNVFEDLGVHYAIVGVDYIRLPGPQSPASGTTSASLVGAVLHELSKDGEDDEWLYVVGSGRIDTASNALTTSLKAESAEAARCLITELVEKEAMHSGDEASAIAASALARAHAERLIAEAATCGDLATRGRSLGEFFEGSYFGSASNKL